MPRLQLLEMQLTFGCDPDFAVRVSPRSDPHRPRCPSRQGSQASLSFALMLQM